MHLSSELSRSRLVTPHTSVKKDRPSGKGIKAGEKLELEVSFHLGVKEEPAAARTSIIITLF